jgi:hypothetical protein
MMQFSASLEKECRLRGVSYEVISEGQVTEILMQIAKPDLNM